MLLYYMLSLSLIMLIFGMIFNSNNFMIMAMILELIYLIIGLMFISYNLDEFMLIIIGITASESALGLSMMLSYYLSLFSHSENE